MHSVQSIMEISFCCGLTRPVYSFIDVCPRFDMLDDLQHDQLWGQHRKNSYQTKQKNKENKPLLVELNDHWFPLKVRWWNEWADCDMLHLVSKVNSAQRMRLIPLYVASFRSPSYHIPSVRLVPCIHVLQSNQQASPLCVGVAPPPSIKKQTASAV